MSQWEPQLFFCSNISPSVANPPSNSVAPPPPSVSGNNSGPNSVPTPGLKPGMHSPMTPEGGPRSNQHGPASVGGVMPSSNPSAASPAVATPASASSNYLNKSLASTDPALNAKAPEASSLVLNLVLSDTLLNVFRDHNFDSCTMCVCNSEGSIRGRDASVYLPELGDDDDVNCSCGYSAVVNRRLAHQSGLFYEDETEVTRIAEDLYFRKKASLLLLDPKAAASDNFTEKSSEVDAIQPALLELIHQQSSYAAGAPNALAKYARQYLRSTLQPPSLSMVELTDGNEVIFVALNQVKTASDPATSSVTKLDEALKGTCLHKWPLLPSAGPMCSEDVIRVMKSLRPLLNTSLHVKKTTVTKGGLQVQGPLTWRQFHHMAGVVTKGNTDDQASSHAPLFSSLDGFLTIFWQHHMTPPPSLINHFGKRQQFLPAGRDSSTTAFC